jgi:succinoglycan biosynthesis transport protein ExoP
MSELVPYNPRAIQRPSPGSQRPIPEGYPEPVSESTSFREYLAIVRRQWVIVATILAIAVGSTLYIVLSAAPRYRANAVVRLADERRAMTGGAGGAGAYDEVLGRETDVLLSQIQVLTSRATVGEAVDSGGLRLAPVRGHALVSTLKDIRVAPEAPTDTMALTFEPNAVVIRSRSGAIRLAYGVPVVADGVHFVVASRPAIPQTRVMVLPRDAAIESIITSFRAAPRPKTDIIDLQFTSTDPEHAQRVVNSVARAFQIHNATGAQQQSRRRRIFLEAQMRQTDSMLHRAQANFSAFRAGRQVFSSKEKATIQQQGMMDVQTRRAELDAERRTYEALLSQAERSRDADNLRSLVSAPGIAANPVIQQLYTQLTKYETERDSMVTAGAASTNPDMVAINQLIASTSRNLLSAVRSQIQSLNARIVALDRLQQQSAVQISTLPATETEEAQLGQQVQTIQKMADQLQEDYQRAKMAEAVEAGQVEIVDLADVPTLPIASGRTRKLALGILLGLLLGVGAAIVVDGMNTSIRRRDDIERFLQVPGLAVIPKFTDGTQRRGLQRTLARRNGKRAPYGDNRLVTLADTRSQGAEAYRTLRTNLIFSQAVQAMRTIVITSASPAEGKTTTVANLAVSFAQQGMRVLLIDCDLRRSCLHKVFHVAREPGMTDLILGNADQEAVTRETPVPGLYVIPSGPLPPNPSELLGGERMRKTLQSLGEGYDLILMDTPPLLAASDAAVLSTLSEGVVLVVRAGVTESEAGQIAMQQLGAVGARVVGAVLNDPDSKVPEYGRYYSYDYATPVAD